MYDIDLFDAQAASTSYFVPGFGTVSVPRGQNAGIVTSLHSKGKKVVCYIDTGATEEFRPDAALFPASVTGKIDKQWPSERWLDIRPRAWSSFEPVILARFDLAKRTGCDGVEGDQNNSMSNDPGFPISAADEKAWYLELARQLHLRGLSAGMKNGLEVTDADTIAAFDWDLNEQCNQFEECGPLNGFIAAGKAVFEVEYTEDGASTADFCPADKAAHFDGLLKHLDLDAWREAC